MNRAKPNRRDFARKMAALAAVPLGVPLESVGAPEPNPAPKPDKPKAVIEAAAALAEVARSRFGQHLSKEQLAEIRRDLEDNGVPTIQALAKATVRNSDEPPSFQADLL
ncbi:MAG: hypothetical protein ACJ8FY_07595 [Gemmataceae bacterium]